MNFLKSFKLIIIFYSLSFFSTLFGMTESPLLKKVVNIEKLGVILMQDTTPHIFHEGISTNLGRSVLLDLLNNPVTSIEILRSRQNLLKQLVILPEDGFKVMRDCILKISKKFDEFLVLDKQIKEETDRLKRFKEASLNLGSFVNPSTLFSLFFIYSMYSTSINGFDFTKSISYSVLFSTLVESFLGICGISPTSMIRPFLYFCAGALNFVIPGNLGALHCNGNTLFQLNANKLLTLKEGACKAGELLTCNGMNAYCDSRLFYRLNQSFWGLLSSRLNVGNALLPFTPLNRLVKFVNSKKWESALYKKRGDARLLLEQIKQQAGIFEEIIKDLRLKRVDFSDEMGIDGMDSVAKYLGVVDVFLGVAALIRESGRVCDSGFERYPISFIELKDSCSKFDFNVSKFCNLIMINPQLEYKIKSGSKSALAIIYPKLNFNADLLHLICNGTEFSQVEFLEKMANPICLQIILAHTLGIVFGKNASMTIINPAMHELIKRLVFQN